MKHKPLSERTAQEVYDEIIGFIDRRIAKLESEKRSEPHPLAFMMSPPEDYDNAVASVRHHNACITAEIGGYQIMAEAMENTYIKIPKAEQDAEDLHRHGAGI